MERISLPTPKSAVKEVYSLVSEDRKGEGLFLIRSARENLTISKTTILFPESEKGKRNCGKHTAA